MVSNKLTTLFKYHFAHPDYPSKTWRTQQNRAHGFTLIEVLVTIAILTLGAIGATRLQLANLQLAKQSAYQSLATQYAIEMAEMIRATASNTETIPAYLFTYQAMTNNNTAVTSCYDTPCSPLQYATFTVHTWQERLNNSFPQAKAVICHDATPWENGKLRWACDHHPHASIIIKIGWQDKHKTHHASSPQIAIIAMAAPS